MNTITIKIEAPELVEALNHLASAICTGQHNIQSVETIQELKAESVKQEVPDEVESTTYSIEDVRAAFSDYAKARGKDKAKAILAKYGANKVTAINSKDYQAVMQDIRGE